MKRIAMGLFAASIFGFATAASAEVDKKVERLWKSKCASCHAVDASGNSEQGKKMGAKDYTTAEWQKAKTDADIKKGIEEGAKGTGGDMEGYKDRLTPEQVDQLVQYIRAMKK